MRFYTNSLLFSIVCLVVACAPTGTVASNLDILMGRDDWTVSGSSSAELNLQSEVYATELTRPVAIRHAGDGSGRLFVVQQEGQIVIVEDGAVLSPPFLNLAGNLSCCGEQGLLGLAFHPDFKQNRQFVISYTDERGDLVVAARRANASGSRALAESSELFRLAQPGLQHNGGHILFDRQGYLYLGTGEGMYYPEPLEASAAQVAASPYGKLIRFSPAELDASYSAGEQASGTVLASGLRNPWRFSIDPVTAQLYLADVGQSSWEEVNVVSLDETHNFGWPLFEGPACQAEDCDTAGYTAPAFSYDHSEGCSVTGGQVYRGTALPALQGAYLFGDFCLGKIWAAAKTPDGWQTSLVLETAKNIATFGADEAGELYFSDYGTGSLYRLVPLTNSTSPGQTGTKQN